MKKTSVQPYLIGVAGGSGSGKTTVVETLMKEIGKREVARIAHDWYYKSFEELSIAKRREINYDHPLSLETELLIKQLQQLHDNQTIEVPQYDFATFSRSTTITLKPAKVIIVEGILLFESKELRELFDLKVFVDTEPDVRLARRLERDVAERGRTFEFGLSQYMEFTRPMHLEFVEPSKRYADIILPEGVKTPAIDVLVAKVLKEIGSE